MRIESNEHGLYRIQPAPASAPAARTNASAPPATARPARESDSVELESISIREARAKIEASNAAKAKLDALVGATVDHPVTFDPPPASSSNPLLDRAYFRRSADVAGLNASATEQAVDVEA